MIADKPPSAVDPTLAARAKTTANFLIQVVLPMVRRGDVTIRWINGTLCLQKASAGVKIFAGEQGRSHLPQPAGGGPPTPHPGIPSVDLLIEPPGTARHGGPKRLGCR